MINEKPAPNGIQHEHYYLPNGNTLVLQQLPDEPGAPSAVLEWDANSREIRSIKEFDSLEESRECFDKLRALYKVLIDAGMTDMSIRWEESFSADELDTLMECANTLPA